MSTPLNPYKVGDEDTVYVVAFWEKFSNVKEERAEQSSRDTKLNTCFYNWRYGLYTDCTPELTKEDIPEDKPLRILFYSKIEDFVIVNTSKQYVRMTWNTFKNVLCQEPKANTAFELHAQLCLTPNVQCCMKECAFQETRDRNENVLRWLSQLE